MSRPGTLFVVATPIGHLEDITLRALRILKTVALVAAEDTRRTGNLLRHYDIHTPLLSVREHNEHARAPRLIERLMLGDSIALVTDAGTPGISDPGAPLVAAVRAAGIRVEPIPGPSAVSAAVSASGCGENGFCFLGFAPIKAKDRNKWFETVARLALDRAVVFFEAPHRVERMLREVGIFVKRPIIVARELTKVHEEFVSGLPEELAVRFAAPQGEFTVIIPRGPGAEGAAAEPDDAEILREFGQLTENSVTVSKREAARAVGERLGITTKRVYEVVEKNK